MTWTKKDSREKPSAKKLLQVNKPRRSNGNNMKNQEVANPIVIIFNGNDPEELPDKGFKGLNVSLNNLKESWIYSRSKTMNE